MLVAGNLCLILKKVTWRFEGKQEAWREGGEARGGEEKEIKEGDGKGEGVEEEK